MKKKGSVGWGIVSILLIALGIGMIFLALQPDNSNITGNVVEGNSIEGTQSNQPMTEAEQISSVQNENTKGIINEISCSDECNSNTNFCLENNIYSCGDIDGDGCNEKVYIQSCMNGICETGQCKSLSGESCYAPSECVSSYCVHNVCRNSNTFCGDNYCDNGEDYLSCSNDCKKVDLRYVDLQDEIKFDLSMGWYGLLWGTIENVGNKDAVNTIHKCFFYNDGEFMGSEEWSLGTIHANSQKPFSFEYDFDMISSLTQPITSDCWIECETCDGVLEIK